MPLSLKQARPSMCTRLPSGTKRRWDSIFRYTLNAGTFPVTPIITRPLA